MWMFISDSYDFAYVRMQHHLERLLDNNLQRLGQTLLTRLLASAVHFMSPDTDAWRADDVASESDRDLWIASSETCVRLISWLGYYRPFAVL
jgi:hypothetical protein